MNNGIERSFLAVERPTDIHQILTDTIHHAFAFGDGINLLLVGRIQNVYNGFFVIFDTFNHNTAGLSNCYVMNL